jgi:hypothetical protein
VLSPQKNLDRASELGFEALATQSHEQMVWLGAAPSGTDWRLPVLEDSLSVNLASRRVVTCAGRGVGPHWRILVLHYLAVRSQPAPEPPAVTFADLPTARSYAEVYRQRTTARLCATVGRGLEGLRARAVALGGRSVPGGDAAFEFDVFPRVTLQLVWHAPDDEFPPSATILLPANLECYFVAEDIVVLSERLVARLCGRPF